MSAMNIATAFQVTKQAPKKSAQCRSGKVLPPLRLTRRGRFVLMGLPLIVAALVIVAMAGIFSGPAKASTIDGPALGSYATKVTVLGGDSLWSIAQRAEPNVDPREVVQQIVQLNNLASSVVQPGEQLFVPVRG